MKLLFVIDCLGSGGAQRQMVNLALALSCKGYFIDFFIYYPDHKHFLPKLQDGGIKVYSAAKADKLGINVIRDLRKLVKDGKYDIVLSFLDTPNFYSEVASIGLNGTKLIVSERCMYPRGKLSASLYVLQQFHRLADHITVNSHHQRERMLKEFPWMRQRISTIYNGLDVSEFAPKGEASPADGHQKKLLAIGSICKRKNACNLIEAMHLYAEAYGDVPTVAWVGNKEISGEGRNTYEEAVGLLSKYGLEPYWEWLGERQDVAELLANHDALIHPSFVEGLPNVVCEALGCGKAVLISDVCDHPRLVTDGVSGFLFDPGSPHDISRAIRRFCTLTAGEYGAMCRKSREYAVSTLSLDIFVTNYENLFQSLLRQ